MTSTPTAQTIQARIRRIRNTLPDSVQLIAITKKCPPEVIRIAYAEGIRDFGESQIQEAIAKQDILQDLPHICWHLIGHLQSNKVRKALERFHWIHSLDSLKLCRRLNDLASQTSQRTTQQPKFCLQVKLRPDPTKYGFTVSDLMEALPELNRYTHLNIMGLMTIPPYNLPPTEIQKIFLQTQALGQQINQQNWSRIHIHQLSMGMSSDYSLALEAGTTMVRLGRILFGERPT